MINNYDEIKKRLEESIKRNIKLDVRAFFLTGKEIPKRDEKWNYFIQEQILSIKEDLEIEEELRHDKVMIKIHKESKEKLSLNEWRSKAEKLYTKEENDDCQWIVTSIASGPEHPRITICESRKEANKFIEQEIKYKYYDHFKRNNTCNFRYDPDSESK